MNLPSIGQAAAVGEPGGMRIIDRALEAYAACSTYADEGEYVLESPGAAGLGGFRDVRPFRTRFIRPGRVLYVFHAHTQPDARGEPPPALGLWNGGQPQTTPIRWWWNLAGKISESPDATVPIGAATGISGGTAAMLVPTLLELDGFPGLLEALVDVRAGAGEEIELLGEPVACDVVLARHSSSPESEIRLSFDRRSGLLVRVEQRSGREREITMLRPRINGAVGEDELVFVPPANERGSWLGRLVQKLFMS